MGKCSPKYYILIDKEKKNFKEYLYYEFFCVAELLENAAPFKY